MTKLILIYSVAKYIVPDFNSTVGPQLSEHLCATSMLKVFR